jgi:transposase
MEYYSGLDVSLEETFITIIDQNGEIVKEQVVQTSSYEIFKYLQDTNLEYKKIGIESGQFSISLCKELVSKGLPVICVDARAMAKALSARINKNDKNDALGIAQMMRANLYKEVKIKSDDSCELKVILGTRNQLKASKQQIMGTVRGLLKIYGLKIPAKSQKFILKVREAIANLSRINIRAIESTLDSLESVQRSIDDLDDIIEEYCRNDEDCRLLMTIPGVGVITAITYKSGLDDPNRFTDSETVGAYMGLTPRQYASGEINRQGSISKMGSKDVRTSLYEAAQSLLIVSKKKSKIKSWGMKIMKKKGAKKAIVAVARKLAVVMHRMLISRREFCY